MSRLEMTCMDAHIHLDLYEENERASLLEAAFESGVEAVVAVSMHLSSSRIQHDLAKRYPGRVHPAYGFHPEQPLPSQRELDELFVWIRERHGAGEPFAIGEVGLPYYKRTEAEAAGRPFNEQPYLELLDRFAELAAELDRPIILHAVYEDAHKACELLERHGVRRAHFHWFKGEEAVCRRMQEKGYFISVTPDIVYEAEIRELAARYPLDLMMVETDGPWPFEGPFAGRRTRPEMAAAAAACLAEVKGLPEQQTASVLNGNTRRFYGF